MEFTILAARQPKQAVAAARKEPEGTAAKIVEGARQCFERFGFEKTTMEDIARAAKISRPTIYKHFPGKAEIVDHIGFGELERIQEVVRTRITWQNSFAELVTEVIVASIFVARENQYIRRFVEELEVTAHSVAPTSPYQIQARARWESVLRRARDSGELAPDLELGDVVNWISHNQVMLLKTIDQIGADETRLRFIVRRFVVEPLLAQRGNVAADASPSTD